MPFCQSDSIRYFAFDSLRDAGVLHGIFTRQGGVSPAPWNSLNVGGTVGDERVRVKRNRQLSFDALGRSVDSLYDVWQVHGTETVCTRSPRPLEQEHLQADAIFTDRPEVTLFMRFADCVPVLLYDPVHKVVGLVHAGWMGTLRGVVSSALSAMHNEYGSQPAEIIAGIGPSIGPHHYEVGPEVAAQAMQAFGQDAGGLLRNSDPANGNSRVKFDLWSANRLLLEHAGVRQVEVAGICTACHLEDWFSHRAENGKTGRFGALIALA